MCAGNPYANGGGRELFIVNDTRLHRLRICLLMYANIETIFQKFKKIMFFLLFRRISVDNIHDSGRYVHDFCRCVRVLWECVRIAFIRVKIKFIRVETTI